jgi:hypothetical protein
MRSIILHRYPDDPICPRVSIGGTLDIGFYCNIRGTKEEAITAIEAVLLALREVPEMEIEPDPPKSELGIFGLGKKKGIELN